MRVHFLQHVPFEHSANIGFWTCERGHDASRTLLYEGEPLPPADAVDLLVILGGPMSVHDRKAHPWLAAELEFIEKYIKQGGFVLGVCLGAQLAALALGARVTRNPEREIGWFPVTLTEGAGESLLGELPEQFVPFHWHGDTFSIPQQSQHLAHSAACRNQAFQYGGRVLGLQFHLDYTAESIAVMIQQCGDDLVEGRWIQKPERMIVSERVEGTKRLLYELLDGIQRKWEAAQPS